MHSTRTQRAERSGHRTVVIDVRERWEYDDFNLGAQLIPLGELMNRVHELEDLKDKEIILHCRSGSRSGMAQNMLTGMGFSNVRNLTGGVVAWIEQFGK